MTNSSIGLTFAYAAPEQIQNQKHITKNVDLWAVGVILYRIMMGELPFGGGRADNKSTQSQLELSRKILQLELPAGISGIPEPYQRIIRRCLVLDPRARAQTAEELIDLLEPEATLEDITVPMIVPVNPPEERVVPDPVPNVPTQEGMETQMLVPEPQKVPVLTPVITDPEPVAPFSPPLYEEAVSQVYEQPHHNPTQFNYRPADPVVEPEPVAPSVPLVGGRRRSRWPWWLAAVLLLGVIAGGWYVYAPPAAEPPRGENEVSEVTVIPLDPFGSLAADVEYVKNNNEALADLLPAIEAEMKNHPDDWRGPYLVAKNYIYQRNAPEGYGFLKKAVGLAISQGEKTAFSALINAEAGASNPYLKEAVDAPEGRRLLAGLD